MKNKNEGFCKIKWELDTIGSKVFDGDFWLSIDHILSKSKDRPKFPYNYTEITLGEIFSTLKKDDLGVEYVRLDEVNCYQKENIQKLLLLKDIKNISFFKGSFENNPVPLLIKAGKWWYSIAPYIFEEMYEEEEDWEF